MYLGLLNSDREMGKARLALQIHRLIRQRVIVGLLGVKPPQVGPLMRNRSLSPTPEQGLGAFPVHTGSRLREFVADQYHGQGRDSEAMELLWAMFIERPGLTSYQTLERHATRAGVWPEWRERAVSEVRARIARANQLVRAQGRSFWNIAEGDRSLLVEIFLHERKLEEAWREAETGGCFDRLWLRLAEAREKDCPEDAASVYLRLAGNLLQISGNSRYEEPVELLIKAAGAMKRANRMDEFTRRLDELRLQYRSKRNFTKLLEDQREFLSGGR